MHEENIMVKINIEFCNRGIDRHFAVVNYMCKIAMKVTIAFFTITQKM